MTDIMQLTKGQLEILRKGVASVALQQRAADVIDAHAADRAALVAQLEEMRQKRNTARDHAVTAESRNDALVAQRDDARAHNDQHERMWRDEAGRADKAEAQVAELTRERDDLLTALETFEAETARLTRERDEAREARRLLAGDCLVALNERDAARHQSEERFEAMTAFSYEVTRLTEALAAAEGRR